RALWTVSRGDVAIGLYSYHGIKFRMVEEVGVVTRYLTVVADPPTIVTEPKAVGQVAFEWRLVERRQVSDE
ncbi:MAG TPA: hypothetical protein VK357_11525, partial [Rubrobacteraceae bacterium]|nr:hypothetical protein [Rubrobacteraceae bacterium]